MSWNFPEDFPGWHQMHTVREDCWIYFDPTNRLAALIDPERKIVYLVYDRKTGEYLYENKAALHSRPRFRGRRLV